MPLFALIDPALLVATALQSASGPDTRVVLPPVWRRRPTAEQIADAHPSDALADGVGGQANLVCEIEPDSTLSHCSAGDPKDGYGFGAAALSLASYFRIRPQTIDGEAAVSGRVVVPIRFDPPADAKPVQALWTTAPSGAEVKAALPKRLAASGELGVGVMRCTVASAALSSCRPAKSETDALGRAAVKLAPKFQIAPAFLNGRATEGTIFDIAVVFDAGDAKGAGSAVLAEPVWLRAPSEAQVQAAFPDMAKSRGVDKITVEETCFVQADGGLGDCRVTSEDPVGTGGAAAAIRLANGYQTTTWTAEGRPTQGSKVDLSLTLQAPAGETKAPAASGTTPAKRPSSTKPTGRAAPSRSR